MYNSETPLRAELPTSKQLTRSTVIAAVCAVALLATVVLPAEYGIDPTGAGRLLGLTEMGEIKTRLAKEAQADAAPAAADAAASTTSMPPAASPAPTTKPAPVNEAAAAAAEKATPAVKWRDEMSITLSPGEGSEVKMRMIEGERASFAWSVQGGVVNFDAHGDGEGRSISYEKGRSVPADEGDLVAAFTGNHGWFWRNRGDDKVTLVLRTSGDYSDLKRMK
ncbi:MAG: transmembrane anchor protein [Hydrogenophaga sp.]|jgi:hypothetical protein|uniref:transmembrane anchor protein n=1 Tax=Hydrogenophaga sp. TaxID=1904254 RepID=UPI0025BB6B3B|nr:transmembrane anchor protein [Hydrogenophaga sp.]MBU4184485.1 transmembrane anchor protein [Gammaproteobacteria bacterium]MBU4280879.1 transmembrane anchor protein [Gammaproteobacteria bacterium]MBU4323454.1 transmembrane anchor protein [Gammaproteobacteria bacterium]MBU4505994.1 transmembrane anchor protein [Gammaproteobacteria bacterium]MCG2658226.1 transmembrane anchor protein [Hydrogenophaga sp.]